MIHTLSQTTKQIIFLTVIILGLVAYSFLNASWTPAPAGVPPVNNAVAPINIGTSTQSIQNGSGDLVFDRMVAVNEIRSAKYCDVFGQNCLQANKAGERILKVASISNHTRLTATEVRNLWNSHVQRTWDNGNTQLHDSRWKDECTWNSNEVIPIGTLVAKESASEAWDWCGLIMCRFHPDLFPLTHAAVVSSNAAACSTSDDPSCGTGNFDINCIY